MIKRYESKAKPSKCPKCGSARVAKILYGMPIGLDGIGADLDAGKIVLGGCELTGDDPAWQCLDCETGIHKTR